MRYYRNIRYAFFFGFLLTATLGQSQEKVGGTGFNLLLKSLLDHSVPEVAVRDIKNELGNYVLLDSRELKEYEVSHLEGALHVGYDHFDMRTLEGISKDVPILVYCSVGYRSEKIAEKLIDAGYTDVYNLYGGIFEWVNEGNDVYNAKGKTEKIHVYSPTWGVWCHSEHKVSN